MKLNRFNAREGRVQSYSISCNRLSLQLGFVLLASVLWLAGANKVNAEESLTQVERVVPEFSLFGVDDKEWNEESLAGKFWVVNFWATWCPPCIEEIPSMNRAWQVLEPAGIGMLAINTGEDRGAVQEFLGKIPIEFPTLLGNLDTMANWSARALPTTLVIDREGNVVFEALGPREWDDADLLQRIIALQD